MAGEMTERIGARIRERRLELGMKQRELADKLGSDAIDNQRVSDWERGVNRPSDRYMEALAIALERDVAWFFKEDPDAPTPDLFAGQNETEDRLARMEQRLDEHAQRVEELLARQSRILERIEAAIQIEDEAAQRLNDVDESFVERVAQLAAEAFRPEPRTPERARRKPSKSRSPQG